MIAAAAAISASCASAPQDVPRGDPAVTALAHAGARTYAGTLSCAGCAQRALILTILADGTYRLRQSAAQALQPSAADSREPQRTVRSEFGRWSVAPQSADVLELQGGNGASWRLRRVAPDGLELLDHEGREMRGLEGAILARVARVDPLGGPFRLAGHYRNEDGRPVFVECLTGQRLPVVTGVAANDAPGPAGSPARAQETLEGAIAALAPAPGEAVLAIVQGYFVPGSAQSRGAPRESLVVAGFERAVRDGRCEDAIRSAR